MIEPRFALSDENAGPVAQICARLEGIPLALELTAARVQVLSVEEIPDRLDDCLRLLTGGARAQPTRQQTLSATLGRSYDLLTEPAWAVFRRLVVFRGGSRLEMAEAVCAGEGVVGVDVLDLVTRLADKSLVVANRQDRASRFRTLEPVRQYAERCLEAAGEVVAVGEWHRACLTALAEEAVEFLQGPAQTRWLVRLEREREVAALIGQGCCSDRQLADRLTITTHVDFTTQKPGPREASSGGIHTIRSSDISLRINDDEAPNFTATTTQGAINFHDWIGNDWAILFSHPKDFTPVCTTELGYMAKLEPEFTRRNCKFIGLSVEPIDCHARWLPDIEETQGYAVNYPVDPRDALLGRLRDWRCDQRRNAKNGRFLGRRRARRRQIADRGTAGRQISLDVQWGGFLLRRVRDRPRRARRCGFSFRPSPHRNLRESLRRPCRREAGLRGQSPGPLVRGVARSSMSRCFLLRTGNVGTPRWSSLLVNWRLRRVPWVTYTSEVTLQSKRTRECFYDWYGCRLVRDSAPRPSQLLTTLRR